MSFLYSAYICFTLFTVFYSFFNVQESSKRLLLSSLDSKLIIFLWKILRYYLCYIFYVELDICKVMKTYIFSLIHADCDVIYEMCLKSPCSTTKQECRHRKYCLLFGLFHLALLLVSIF